MKRYVLLWMLLLGQYAYSQTDGSLDSTFASKGWAGLFFTNGNNNYDENTYQTLVQSDGKMIVLFTGVNGNAVLARYNADGTLDNTFGISGFTEPLDIYPESAALQNDGKIIVTGEVFDYNTYTNDFAVARFTPVGILDKTFGSNGIATAGFTNSVPVSVAIQPADGKIVVGGYSGNYEFALARFNINGTMDNTFGTAGKVITDLAGPDEIVRSVAIQADGKIVAGGFAYSTTTGYDFAMVRYTSTGTLDANFNTTGIVTIDFTGMDEGAYSVAIQADGKIVAGGYVYTASTGIDFALARLNSNGTQDNTFGTDGKVVTDIGGYDEYITSVVIQGDGKLAVGGYTYKSSGNFDFALARFTSNGTLDNTFGTDGITTTDFFEGNDYAYSVFIGADGKFIVGGDAYNSSGNTDFALARYTSNGILDNTFNTTGKLVGYSPAEAYSIATGIALQPDGKMIVAGYTTTASTGYDFALARYNSDGTLDVTFGTGGKVVTDFAELDDYAYSVAIQTDGKIVVAGGAGSTDSYNFALARYNSDGTLDNTFNTTGKVTTNFPEGTSGALSVVLQADGKIVAAGYFNSSSTYYDFALARYNSDGTLDNTFNTTGTVITDFGGNDQAYSVALQADGKIVATGSAGIVIGLNFALARYNSDGTLDNTFNTTGTVITDFGGNDEAYSVAIQADGKIVAVGYTDNNGIGFDFALARYNSDGTADATFGTSGLVKTDFGNDNYASAVAIQTDGKIIVAGSAYSADNYQDLALARYNSDGTLDATFGTGGKLVTDFDASIYITNVIWKNNKLYAVGPYQGPHYSTAFTAVYNTAASTPPPTGLPLVSINDVTVSENAGTATLTVSLNKASTSDIIINYVTQDSTAVSKGRYPDYRSVRGTVTIAKGNTTASISVVIRTDNQTENDEYFKVLLSLSRKMTNLAKFGDSLGVVTIVNVSSIRNAIAKADNLNKVEEQGKLNMKVYPNPSTGYFTLQLQSTSTAPVSISVTDALGKVVETRSGLAVNNNIQLGSMYRPGVYYAQVMQGSEKVTVRLVKLNR